MSDVGYVIAAYGVIMGGLGLYTASLLRRLRTARDASLRIRREAEAASLTDRPA